MIELPPDRTPTAEDEKMRVPTVRELQREDEKLVKAIKWDKDGVPTMFRVTDEGHALLGKIMRWNATIAVARGEGDWVRPPSRQIGGINAR